MDRQGAEEGFLARRIAVGFCQPYAAGPGVDDRDHAVAGLCLADLGPVCARPGRAAGKAILRAIQCPAFVAGVHDEEGAAVTGGARWFEQLEVAVTGVGHLAVRLAGDVDVRQRSRRVTDVGRRECGRRRRAEEDKGTGYERHRQGGGRTTFSEAPLVQAVRASHGRLLVNLPIVGNRIPRSSVDPPAGFTIVPATSSAIIVKRARNVR